MIYVKCQEKAIIDKTFLKNLNIITPYREPLKTSGFCIIKNHLQNKTEDKMINWFDMPAEGLSNGGLFEVKELEVTENGTYEEKGEMYNKVTVNVEGGGGEFKIANITWENLPETFDDYDPRSAGLLIKTADGFEDYTDIYAFSEILLAWDDEWFCSPEAIVTTKQPENVGDLAVWLQPYPDTYDFSVVSGDAFIWNRGVILYGDCTLTIA